MILYHYAIRDCFLTSFLNMDHTDDTEFQGKTI